MGIISQSGAIARSGTATTTSPTYWALTARLTVNGEVVEPAPGTELVHGISADEAEEASAVVIAGDPRRLPILRTLWTWDNADPKIAPPIPMHDWSYYVTPRSWDELGMRLVRVVPDGPVGGPRVDGRAFASRWTIAELHAPHALWGPQAGRIRRVAKQVDTARPWLLEDAARRINELAGSDREGMDAALHAAAAALSAIGADGAWWLEVSDGCGPMWGVDIALAARDLIGRFSEWTWQDYALLTSPYQAAFGGGPHPADGSALVDADR